MSWLETILQALVDTLTHTIEDLRGHHVVPDQVIAPAVIVQPSNADYTHVQGEDDATVIVDLQVLVPRTDMATGQRHLLELLSPRGDGSIPQALRDDSTLGGAVEYAVATGFSRYGVFRYGTVEFIGALIRVEIDAS